MCVCNVLSINIFSDCLAPGYKEEESECIAGWTYFPHTNRCYKHFSENKNWADARTFCLSFNESKGDLVSIPDQFTNDFLTTLSSSRSWIGASDAVYEGDWRWNDGTAWRYESWTANEPNNAGHDQNYALINHLGHWNDEYASAELPFFCQIDKGEMFRDSGLGTLGWA